MDKLPGIVFDMDGVITDTEPLHKQAEFAVLAELKMDVPEEEWNGFKGKTEHDIFSYILERYGQGRVGWSVPQIIQRKTEIYLELAKKGLPVVPGAVDFIRRVKQYFNTVGLATSSNVNVQRATFDQHDLWPYFDQVVTGDLVTHGKPHPEIYRLICGKLGLVTADCWVIEDSDNGIRSASTAGCPTIGLTTSFPAEHLKNCGARLVVDGFSELEKRLQAGQITAQT